MRVEALPTFCRAATQDERDFAGAAQRRIEASLHNYWLHLASGQSLDWWNDVVPEETRTLASRRRRGQRASPTPEEMVRRLAFEDFVALFDATYPEACRATLGEHANRRTFVLELLLTARDAAAHPGKPLLSVDAQMVAAVAWGVLQAIPVDHHDPPDQLNWLRDQMLEEGEGWVDEPFDAADEPVSAEVWKEIHVLCRTFKPSGAGDGGFAVAVTDVLGRHHVNVFLQAGELTLGTGLPAFSGLFHENDLGLANGTCRLVFELKQRRRGRVTKSDLMIFNQKTIDFQLALIHSGDRARILRAFITTDPTVTDALRGYCLQWGIILVEPHLRPIPLLVSALRDLDGAAGLPSGYDAARARAERLADKMRPLDRLLLPSTLSRWRRLLDAGRFPTGASLRGLVRDQRQVDEYAEKIAGVDVGS